MPRLIVLNGPPGCGKSVLARRYVDDHPPALNLDIDRVRELLGQWSADKERAGLLARDLALAMARTHLGAGYDVVIPQYLGRLTFLHQVELLAAATGAALHEVVLLDTRQNSLRRWAAREALGTESTRPAGDGERIGELYDRLMVLLESRPNAVLIPTVQGEVEAAYRALLARLDGIAG